MSTGKNITYNMANDDHYRTLTSKLGGEGRIRKRYPELFKTFQRTRNDAIRSASQPRPLLRKSAGDTNGFTDYQGIRELEYYEGLLHSSSKMGTVEATPVLSIVGELKDLITGKALGSCAVYDTDSHCLRGAMDARAKANDRYSYGVESTFTKVVYDKSGAPLISAATLTENCTEGDDAKNIIERIDITDPLPNKTHGDVTVIYYNNRKGPGCDYYFDNVKQQDNNVQIMLPFKGSVQFDLGFKPLYVDRNNSFTLRIEEEESGSIPFGLAGWDKVKINVTGNTLSWEFPDDWYNFIYKSQVKVANNVDFYCKMVIACSQPIGINGYIPIYITSDDDAVESYSLKKIPKLRFEWGCFAKGTRIKMSDGSYKRVSEIRAGERVMTASGSAAVTEVIGGTEKDLVVVSTSGGRTVRVSRDHPVLTGSGWRAAGNLTAADILRTESGLEGIEALYIEAYNDNVFSLRTDGEGTLIADGIFAGDFGQQNNAEPKKKKPLNELQQEFADLMATIAKEKEACHD